MIKIMLNGQPLELAEPTPLGEYLRQRGVNPATVAVEVNGRILSHAERNETVLQDGDVVEIVRMVGGGA